MQHITKVNATHPTYEYGMARIWRRHMTHMHATRQAQVNGQVDVNQITHMNVKHV